MKQERLDNGMMGSEVVSMVSPLSSQSPYGNSAFSCTLMVKFAKLPPVRAALDTGSPVSLMSHSFYKQLNQKTSVDMEITDTSMNKLNLRSISGVSLAILGTVKANIRLNYQPLAVEFLIIPDDNIPQLTSVLLGCDFCSAHILSVNFVTRELILQKESHSPVSIEVYHITDGIHNTQPTHYSVKLLHSLKLAPQSSVRVEGVTLPISTSSMSTNPFTANAIHSEYVPIQDFISLRRATTGNVRTANWLFTPSIALLNVISPLALVNRDMGLIPVEINNSSNQYCYLHGGDIVGSVSAVEVVSLPLRINEVKAVGSVADYPTRTEQISQEVPDVSGTTSLNDLQRVALSRLLQKNRRVFSYHKDRVGVSRHTAHGIDTGTNPPISTPPYRVGPSQRMEIDRHVEAMLDNNIIIPSESPYSSPVLLVKKSDGSMRFCVDFRKLNSITKRDVYPLPRIDDTLDALGKASIFSTLDLQSGFWQLPLNPEDREKTAFSTARGHYEFVVLPFGLTNAPSTFQRVMDYVLRKHKEYCLVYVDDIIIFSASFEEHLIHLQAVFDSLMEAHLIVKTSKCKIGQNEVKFLGYLISAHIIRPDKGKVEAVMNFPIPKRVVELQSFVGLVGYYRRFIPQMATIAAPLYKLFKKGSLWEWTSAHQSAFDELKRILTSKPLLTLPDFDKDFILHTDASDIGLGALLTQISNDARMENVLYYASKSLNHAQKNYTVTEKECLAVLWAVKLFRPYLLGRHFKVFTDHAALRWLMSHKDPSSRLTRMILQLQEYSMEIISRPGSANANADALSRSPALLQNNNATVHLLCSAVTRFNTHHLPPIRRTGVDPDLVLHPSAYDLDLALYESQYGSDHSESDPTQLLEEKDDDSGMLHPNDEFRPEHVSHRSEEVEVTDLGNEGDSFSTSLNGPLEISQSQREDATLLPVIQFIEKGILPSDVNVANEIKTESSHYRLYQSVLMRVDDQSDSSHAPSNLLVVIPDSLKRRVLCEYHDAPYGGHLGLDKTYARLKNKYYWRNMYADVKSYVNSCHLCALKKNPIHHELPLKSIPYPTQPFECLGIDVLGPLPRTNAGNQYVLVITDHFTKWPIALPMKNQRAHTIATLLVERVFCEHGYASVLLSDRGTNFLSELMESVLQLFKIRHLRTTAYHPQTNGLTERFNRTLTTMLTHYINSNQSDWDVYLPYVLYAYRTAPHHTTKHSPFYLLYGREAVFPLDTELSSYFNLSRDESSNIDDYMSSLVEKLRIAHEAVRSRVDELINKRREYNSTVVNVPDYSIGSKVLLYIPALKPGRRRKLSALWRGPYEVVDQLNDKLNYKVQLLDKKGRKVNNAKVLLVHVARLKRYIDPNSSNIRSDANQ